MPRWLVPVLAVVILTACGVPWLHPKLSDAPPRPGRDAEYEVYSELLAEIRAPVVVGDSTFSPAERPSVPKAFAPAWEDYQHKRATELLLGHGFDPTLRVQLARETPAPPPVMHRCPKAVPLVHFSRVGFDADTTHAVVFVYFAEGEGPVSRCGGFRTVYVVYLARKPGRRWRRVGGTRLMIT